MSIESMTAEHELSAQSHSISFAQAIAAFDAENGRDPHTIEWQGERIGYELFYAQRLTEWVLRLAPAASEALRLAARSQHLCRWEIPRQNYEATRAGYLRWRADLKKFHANRSGGILRLAGYGEAMAERVQALNLKQGLGSDPEVQVLEDALCLVTLEFQLDSLLEKMTAEKLTEVLRKTWRKMSPSAHQLAKGLSYSAGARSILAQALAAPPLP